MHGLAAADNLRLNLGALDFVILLVYFVLVVGIGVLARRSVATSEDFFLAGRALPAWVTGLAFISANLGAIEILGMAANGAQYGFSTVHFYWIGAVPAMVFLGIFMMPFYYSRGSTACRSSCGADSTSRVTWSTASASPWPNCSPRGSTSSRCPSSSRPCWAGPDGSRSSSPRARPRLHHCSAGCPAPSTTRSCSSSSSSPASFPSSSSGSPRSGAGAACKPRSTIPRSSPPGAARRSATGPTPW